MQPRHKIDLIFTVNGQTVAIQDVSSWTVDDIIKLLRLQKKHYPDREYRIKRKEVR